ncbi:MAG: FHA domain-containing protein, partial [Anaerolineae bacterium]|nr:FHA domain-containing protein [Anaerolineae bacterium]
SLQVQAFHGEEDATSTELLALSDLPLPLQMRNPQLLYNGQVFPLERPVINLGRRRDNHIAIDSPYVSRYHAQLRLRFGRYVIYDLNSRGGTFVNGHRITECLLKSGDVIGLSQVLLVYMEDEPTAPQAHHDTQMHSPLTPESQ